MFSFFKGLIKELFVNNHSILVVNNLFGLEIYTPYIFNPHEEVELYIYTNYSTDNSISFYGFKTLDHKNFFEILISVPGLGAKTAIKLLASLNFSGVAHSIINKEIKLITKIPGIGTKIANRIVNDLSDKITKEFMGVNEDNTYDLLSALLNIGYDKNHILNILNLIDKNLNFEEQLRSALLLLSKK